MTDWHDKFYLDPKLCLKFCNINLYFDIFQWYNLFAHLDLMQQGFC